MNNNRLIQSIEFSYRIVGKRNLNEFISKAELTSADIFDSFKFQISKFPFHFD